MSWRGGAGVCCSGLGFYAGLDVYALSAGLCFCLEYKSSDVLGLY